MSEEQQYRRQIFLDLVEGENVDHSRVDLLPTDGAVIFIRVGQERVSFVLEQLRLDGLKATPTVIVPAGTFVAMSVELGAFGLGSLQVLGIVERSRPSLTVRFEGNDLVVRERLTATVAQLADKLAVEPPPMNRTQIIPREREPDQPVDVLELKATVTRLMFEKEELRRDLQDFRSEALAMMRLLRREIEARNGSSPPAAAASSAPSSAAPSSAAPSSAAPSSAAPSSAAPSSADTAAPSPPAAASSSLPSSPMASLPSALPSVSRHSRAPEVSAVVRAAFNDDLAASPDAPATPAPRKRSARSAPPPPPEPAAEPAHEPTAEPAEAAAGPAEPAEAPAEPGPPPESTEESSFASSVPAGTPGRRVRPPVLLGQQLIDEFLSEAEAAWSAMVENTPSTVVVGQPIENTDPHMRFDLSDL